MGRVLPERGCSRLPEEGGGRGGGVRWRRFVLPLPAASRWGAGEEEEEISVFPQLCFGSLGQVFARDWFANGLSAFLAVDRSTRRARLDRD